jgi:hypothetical protein
MKNESFETLGPIVVTVDSIVSKINKTYMRMTTKHSDYTMDKLVIAALFE